MTHTTDTRIYADDVDGAYHRLRGYLSARISGIQTHFKAHANAGEVGKARMCRADVLLLQEILEMTDSRFLSDLKARFDDGRGK